MTHYLIINLIAKLHLKNNGTPISTYVSIVFKILFDVIRVSVFYLEIFKGTFCLIMFWLFILFHNYKYTKKINRI
jgi:hypothetical protein